MNCLKLLFIGIFACFASSWLGLVWIPNLQIGHLQPEVDADTKAIAPPSMTGNAKLGSRVYAANGCVYCHTQQVLSESQNADIARQWGTRRTVARDYLNDKTPFLGSVRVGPDLTNYGQRQTNAAAIHQFLYSAGSVSGSAMPSYRFLYETRKVVGQPSPDALKLEGRNAPKPGYEVVPSRDAKLLVSYLLSLDHSYALPEAPQK